MSPTVRPPSPDRISRGLRHRDTKRKLSGFLFEALAEVPEVTVVGGDPLVFHFALAAGIDPGALAACQTIFDDRTITLVGVPSRLWYSTDAMHLMQRVKGKMETMGRPCILLPQKALSALGRRHREGGAAAGPSRLLVDLIRDRDSMGVAACCNRPECCDPIGCSALQLLTGNDCAV